VTADEIRTRIATDGFVIVPEVLDRSFIERSRNELAQAIAVDTGRYGPQADRDYGMVMLCALHGGTFLDLFDNNRLVGPFSAVLGDV
jgi:hypothetical protein